MNHFFKVPVLKRTHNPKLRGCFKIGINIYQEDKFFPLECATVRIDHTIK
jgi:hypothetical protein